MISPRPKAERFQVEADRCFAHAEQTCNFRLTPAVQYEPRNFGPSCGMSSEPSSNVLGVDVGRVGVIEFQVLHPVIRSVAIQMVDSFGRPESPAEVLFHDPAVLKDSTAFAIDPRRTAPVSSRRLPDTRQPIKTRAGKGIQPLDATRIGAVQPTLSEWLLTGLAGEWHAHSVAVA